jgi:5-methylcytosine-specific restriction endonuclease McrA
MDRKLRQKLQSRIYGGAWRRVRPKVLERDGGRCQLRLKGCRVVATEVDHIVPVDVGGALYDEANLRASCRHCNRSRENERATADPAAAEPGLAEATPLRAQSRSDPFGNPFVCR